MDHVTGNKNLSHAVWNLRKALELVIPAPSVPAQTRRAPDTFVLEVGPETLRLRVADDAIGSQSAGGCWIDGLAFEAAARRARHAATVEGRRSAAHEALGLYRGDLLPEAHQEEWAYLRRAQLKDRWVQVALVAAHAQLEAGLAEEALGVLVAVLQRVPEHLGAAEQAMLVLARSGQMHEALGLYASVRRRYKAAYGSEPLELRRVAEQIRTGYYAPRVGGQDHPFGPALQALHA